MTVLRELDFEQFAEDATITGLAAPWSVSATTTPIVAKAAAAIKGTRGARIANTNAFAQIVHTETTDAVRVYQLDFVVRALPATIYPMVMFNGATNLGNWRINLNGTVAIRNGTVATGTSTAALSVGTHYRAAWMKNAGTQELRIYEGTSDTPLLTLTGPIGAGASTDVRIGMTTNVAGAGIDFDSLIVADDWVVSEVDPPPTGEMWDRFFVENGTLVPLTVQYDLSSTTPTEPMGYIGDSLTFQDGFGCLANGGSDERVAQSLSNYWSPMRVDGEIGRPIVNTVGGISMQTVIDNWRADSFDPTEWTLALGSNNTGATDANWITWIGQALAKVAEGPKPSYTVYWIGIAFRDSVADTRATRFWSVLQGIVPPAKINFVPIDYNTLIHAQPQAGLWTSDSTGRHMTTELGYGTRNSVIRDALVGV